MAIASPRASARPRRFVPEDWEPREREHRRLLAEVLNDVRRGKMVNTGRFVLPGDDLTVTVTNSLVETGSHISVTPIDAGALTRYSGGYWIETEPGQFTFMTPNLHPHSEDAGFSYAIFS